MGEEIGIEGLGDLAIQVILSKLDPDDTARICCVSKKFRDWASDDYYWSLHASHDLHMASPVDPFGNPVPSFKLSTWCKNVVPIVVAITCHGCHGIGKKQLSRNGSQQ